MPNPTAADAEIAAMRRIVTTLEQLDNVTRSRVVRWLEERYCYVDHDQAPDATASDAR